MNNSEEELFDFNYSVEEEFTRPPSREHELNDLTEMAYRLLKRNYGYKSAQNRLDTEPPTLRYVIDQIALVIAKTYVECGDSFQLADDLALMRIRDLLIEYHPGIIFLSRNNKLRKHLSK